MRNIHSVHNPMLSIVAVGLLVGPLVAQAEYDYQSIDYPGATGTQVFSINDRGDAVGNGFAIDTMPFIYDTKTGGFTDVTPLVGYDVTAVVGISDSGVLVGSVRGPATESGLILDKKGSATVFDHPDAWSLTQARGVNNKGLVTGFRDSEDSEFLPEYGFIFDPKTGDFTDIVPSEFTVAQGINSRGDVVGSALFSDEDNPCPGFPPLEQTGWLRTADGDVTFFRVNGRSTRARGISDSGIIAGFYTDITTGLGDGFVVELDGSQCQSITVDQADLLTFPGAQVTFVSDIKNSGEVVGSYLDGNFDTHGFIATPR